MKLTILSTPVAPLGSGLGGGVELQLTNLAQEMLRRGHKVQVVAPQDSVLANIPLVTIPGNSQIHAQTLNRDAPVCLPGNSVLANMWDYARTIQGDYDLIVSFAFDWLPFYLTPFFECPIAHFISMGSLTNALDQIMGEIATNFPGTVGVNTKAQAATFPFAEKCICVGNGIDFSSYQFQPQPKDSLAWIGRISPEKALEDAVAAAQITGMTLKIFGKIQDKSYWQQILQDYPQAPLDYRGFVDTQHLQEELGECCALLMTHRWVEAFGIVAIEALACGVPVISYNRGGPAEIIKDGENGFLVEPDNVQGLLAAIKSINKIDRYACRKGAEKIYSLEAFGDRFEAWFKDIVG